MRGPAVLFFIYVDSYMFVLSSAIIQYGIGININLAACDAAIIVCLVFYVTTKVCLALASTLKRREVLGRNADCFDRL